MRSHLTRLLGVLAVAIVVLSADTSTAAVYGRTSGSGGGNGVGWDATAYATCLQYAPHLTDYEWSDFLHPYEYDISSGANKFAQLASTGDGILHANSSASSGYYFLAGQNNFSPPGSAPITPILNPLTLDWCVATRMRFTAGLSGSYFADVVATSGTTDGSAAGWRASGAASTTVLQLQISNVTGGTTTLVAANAAGTIGSGITLNTFVTLVVAYNAVTGTITGAVNGNLAAQTTTLTNLTSQPSTVLADHGGSSPYDADTVLIARQRQN